MEGLVAEFSSGLLAGGTLSSILRLFIRVMLGAPRKPFINTKSLVLRYYVATIAMPGFTLVLGTPVNGVPRPWEYMDLRAVMVNGYEILSSGKLFDLRGTRLRKVLGISDDVELWIDSGGYQFLRRGIIVPPYKIAKLFKEIDADYYVSLDVPPGPGDSRELVMFKLAKTINNFIELRGMLRNIAEEGRLVPVFHMSVGSQLRMQLSEYEPHASTAAVGGLVPYIMQRHGKGSRLKALLFMALVRKLWVGRLHALGLASAAMIPLLKRVQIDSGDTQTWRLKAAYGKVIIPGLGERHVSGRQVSFGPAVLRDEVEERVFRKLVHTVKDKLGIRMEDLVESFTARALFNAWILCYVAENGHEYNGASKAFVNLYRKAEELSRMSVAEIEEMLSGLLRGSGGEGDAAYIERRTVDGTGGSSAVGFEPTTAVP